MKYLLILAIPLLLPYAIAVNPEIIGVAGDFSQQNNVVTINGQDFGNHELNIEWTGKKIEETPVGTNPRELGPEWGHYQFTQGHVSQDMQHITDDVSWSGSKSIDLEVDQVEMCQGLTCSARLSYDIPEGDTWDKLFISYWFKIKGVRYDHQIGSKHLWITDNRVGDPNDYPYPYGTVRNAFAFTGGITSSTGVMNKWQGGMGALYYCPDLVYRAHVDPFLPPAKGVGYDAPTGDGYWVGRMTRGASEWLPEYGFSNDEWVRLSYYLDRGDWDTYNGELYTSTFRPEGQGTQYGLEPGLKIGMWINRTMMKSARTDCGLPVQGPNIVGFYLFTDDVDNRAHNLHWLDDVYIQTGTRARVELGNTPLYKDATRLEIQNPTYWQDDQIRIELNLGGSFVPGETAYLYVINEDEWDVGNRDAYGNGEYNFQGISEGYEIQLGEGPSGPYIARQYGQLLEGEEIILQGLNFGNSGTLLLCDTAVASGNCDTQTTNSWSDTELSFNLEMPSFDRGAEAYFIVQANADSSNAYAVSLLGGTQCDPGEYRNCDYPDASYACPGQELCVYGLWNGICEDADLEDNCPSAGDTVVLQNGFEVVPNMPYSGEVDACIKAPYNPDPGREDKTFDTCRFYGSGERIFMKFDMSVLEQERNISNASLLLYEYSSSSRAKTNVSLRRVLKSWEPNGVTWNCRNDLGNDGCDTNELGWAEPGAFGSSDSSSVLTKKFVDNTAWVEYDVTNLVKDWYANPDSNFGVVFDEVDQDAYVDLSYDNYVYDDDNKTDRRPKLIIEFEPLTAVETPECGDDICDETESCNTCEIDCGICTPSCDETYDIVGDCNGVDFEDFMIVVAAFRTTNPDYDFNNDNQVNVLDLVLHLLNWS